MKRVKLSGRLYLVERDRFWTLKRVVAFVLIILIPLAMVIIDLWMNWGMFDPDRW